MRVLYFGRFQPFHYGHLYALEWLLQRYDEVLVLIGMASESHTFRNPFTAGERMAMIEAVVEWRGLGSGRVRTAVMPTLEVYTGYSHYILNMFSGVEAVATANKPVALAFKHAGVKVVVPPLIDRDRYRGEYIRRLIARGDSKWRELVPPPVAEIVDAVEGQERLKTIINGE